MSVSSAELAKTTEAVTEEAAPTQVLITTSQVLFNTAAARSGHRDKTGGRFGMLRRFFGTSIDASHPRPHDAPRRYSFIESALMEREMGRL
jgi:hypothetical protein